MRSASVTMPTIRGEVVRCSLCWFLLVKCPDPGTLVEWANRWAVRGHRGRRLPIGTIVFQRLSPGDLLGQTSWSGRRTSAASAGVDRARRLRAEARVEIEVPGSGVVGLA